MTVLAGLLFFAFSCTCNDSENQQALTFDTIEKGTSLEDAKTSLAADYEEYNIGSNPDIDVLKFADGRQLVFTDDILTDKNTEADLEEALENKPSGKS